MGLFLNINISWNRIADAPQHTAQGAQWKQVSSVPYLVAASAPRVRLVYTILTQTQPTSYQEICQGKQQRYHHIRDSIRLSFQQGLEVWCREG